MLTTCARYLHLWSHFFSRAGRGVCRALVSTRPSSALRRSFPLRLMCWQKSWQWSFNDSKDVVSDSDHVSSSESVTVSGERRATQKW